MRQAISQLAAADVQQMMEVAFEGRTPESKVKVNWSAVARAVGVQNENRDGPHLLGHRLVRDVLAWCDVPHEGMFKHKKGPKYRSCTASVTTDDGTRAMLIEVKN